MRGLFCPPSGTMVRAMADTSLIYTESYFLDGRDYNEEGRKYTEIRMFCRRHSATRALTNLLCSPAAFEIAQNAARLRNLLRGGVSYCCSSTNAGSDCPADPLISLHIRLSPGILLFLLFLCQRVRGNLEGSDRPLTMLLTSTLCSFLS